MTTHRRYPQWCTQCEERWAQSYAGGLCRTCALGAGVMVLSTRKVEAQRLRRQQERAAQRSRVPESELQPRPSRSVTVQHHEYEVVWDGT